MKHLKLYDVLHIWAGSVGNIKIIGKIAVPEKCWKVIYILNTNQWTAYLFNNVEKPEKGLNLNSYQVDIKVIKDLTGLSFL